MTSENVKVKLKADLFTSLGETELTSFTFKSHHRGGAKCSSAGADGCVVDWFKCFWDIGFCGAIDDNHIVQFIPDESAVNV